MTAKSWKVRLERRGRRAADRKTSKEEPFGEGKLRIRAARGNIEEGRKAKNWSYSLDPAGT